PRRTRRGRGRLRRRGDRAARYARAAVLGARSARRPSCGGVARVVKLAGRRVLVTGAITRESIAYATAAQLQQAGAEVVLTSFGRARRLTERAAQRLPQPPEVLELDVNCAEHYPALVDALRERWGGLDGIVHAVAFAPADALGGRFLSTPPASA